MSRSRLVLILFIVLIPFAAYAKSGKADPKLVKRYIELGPNPRKMITSFFQQFVGAQGDIAVSTEMEKALSYIDFKAIDKALAESISRRYTNRELYAVVKFLSSPEGQSYLTKQPLVTQDVAGVISRELMSATQKYKESLGHNAKQ